MHSHSEKTVLEQSPSFLDEDVALTVSFFIPSTSQTYRLACDVHLYMHTGTVPSFMELTVDLHLSKERILGIVRSIDRGREN